MSQIVALTVAGNEPPFFQNLPFGGVPKMIDHDPRAIDLTALTDDGCTLVFERKTASDFLNSLKDDRLFPQLARMTEIRNASQRCDEQLTYFPYLVITGQLLPSANGKVNADGRETGWNYASIQGTLLSIQEAGVFVVFCNGDTDYEDCILRIGKRDRKPSMKILPARPMAMLGPKIKFLSGIDGVDVEYSQKILKWSNDNVAHALVGLTDLSIKAPIPFAVRKRFCNMLGLSEGENLVINGINGTEPVKGEKGIDYDN